MDKYEITDIHKSFNWLGHAPYYTELSAFHKNYQPGKQHYESNFKNRAFPKNAYAQSVKQVEAFVRKNYKDHLLCYGLNPRTKIFRNVQNFPRSAKESEIEIVKNVLFDFDFKEKKYLEKKLENLEINFKQFDDYFFDHGLKEKPVRAFTGQGYHLLFATSDIKVEKHPDINIRVKSFQDQFKTEFNEVLENLGVKVDPTYDNGRKIKIYGTAKPDIGVTSCFFGEERKEDAGLRDYLLNMKLPEIKETNLVEKVNGELPKLFSHLLKTDSRLHDLWKGNGKNGNTDTSRTGYDFSLARYLIHEVGYSNIDDLQLILSKRPDGAVLGSGKGDQYIRQTISSAIKQ